MSPAWQIGYADGSGLEYAVLPGGVCGRALLAANWGCGCCKTSEPDADRAAALVRAVGCVNGCVGLNPEAIPELVRAATIAASCESSGPGLCRKCRAKLLAALAAVR